jgi:NADH-quinone oxidoreductase subunit N
VAMSLVSAYYYLRVVVAMYMQPPTGEEWSRIGGAAAVALVVALLAVLWLGVEPGRMLDSVRSAVAGLR